MESHTLLKIKRKIEAIEKEGHGEVVIKIKNGVVYRILKTEDELEVKVKENKDGS